MPKLPKPHVFSETEAQQAKELSQRLSKHVGKDLKVHLEGDPEPLLIPKGVLKVLHEVLVQTSLGRSVTSISLTEKVPAVADAILTTQQAANLLKVSRPYLVKLLEQGYIPFRKVGTHRRVALADLLHYQAKAKDEQTQALRELQQQAQELKMGY